jgi:hypothetical protein
MFVTNQLFYKLSTAFVDHALSVRANIGVIHMQLFISILAYFGFLSPQQPVTSVHLNHLIIQQQPLIEYVMSDSETLNRVKNLDASIVVCD